MLLVNSYLIPKYTHFHIYLYKTCDLLIAMQRQQH